MVAPGPSRPKARVVGGGAATAVAEAVNRFTAHLERAERRQEKQAEAGGPPVEAGRDGQGPQRTVFRGKVDFSLLLALPVLEERVEVELSESSVKLKLDKVKSKIS